MFNVKILGSINLFINLPKYNVLFIFECCFLCYNVFVFVFIQSMAMMYKCSSDTFILFGVFYLSSGFPKIVMRTLRNPIYLLVVLAQVNLAAMVAGLATFMGKFIERQFAQTASFSNMMMGELPKEINYAFC